VEGQVMKSLMPAASRHQADRKYWRFLSTGHACEWMACFFMACRTPAAKRRSGLPAHPAPGSGTHTQQAQAEDAYGARLGDLIAGAAGVGCQHDKEGFLPGRCG